MKVYPAFEKFGPPDVKNPVAIERYDKGETQYYFYADDNLNQILQGLMTMKGEWIFF